ncbi:MAG TPA: universal stress protein [Methylomirabilota bacterium]|nr:universal stress protein [Methylomirabilota bacterium]
MPIEGHPPVYPRRRGSEAAGRGGIPGGRRGHSTRPGVNVTYAVRHGRPADEILAATREGNADLIAMATHGRTGLSRVLFGSVAEAVLRNASVPVFLIRQPQPGPPGTCESIASG